MQAQDKEMLQRMFRVDDLPCEVVNSHRRVAHFRGVAATGPMDLPALLLVAIGTNIESAEEESPAEEAPASAPELDTEDQQAGVLDILPGRSLQNGMVLAQGARFYVYFEGAWRQGAYDGRAAKGKLRFKLDADPDKQFRLIDSASVRMLDGQPAAETTEV